MKKSTRKIFKYTIVFGLIAYALGKCIYFVAGMSATFPPIRIYEYQGDSVHFVNSIYHLTTICSEVSIKDTEKVGVRENGYALYMTIEDKIDTNNIEYGLKIEKSDKDKPSPIKVSLTSLFDETRGLGGYGIKAVGMQKLLYDFEHNFLAELNKKEHIKLQPLRVSKGWFFSYWN